MERTLRMRRAALSALVVVVAGAIGAVAYVAYTGRPPGRWPASDLAAMTAAVVLPALAVFCANAVAGAAVGPLTRNRLRGR